MTDFFEQVYLEGVDEPYVDASVAVSLAHVLMLAETGIIPRPDAGRILAELLAVGEAGLAGFPLDRSLGDPLPNLENHLIAKLGDDVGGRFHTGRSRGDYYVALSRLKFRRLCLELLGRLADFREAVLAIAGTGVDAVMPGYTHLQHAQPITLAHYLLSVAHQLERDHDRLRAAFDRINLSPLGLGIIATSSFPLDRERTAGLLGFAGLVRNGRDLVDRDHVLELTASSAILMVHLHKLATDLYEWTTAEFGLVRVADEDAMTSSMMPQKANPVLLELVRARTGNVYGSMTAAFAIAKGSPANNVEASMIDAPALQAVKETIRAVGGFAPVLGRLTFDRERMARLAGEHWSQATDLADLLVRDSGISFREAHRVVGRLVATAMERGIRPAAIDTVLLAEAAEGVLGRPLELSEELLATALDPRRGVAGRSLPGGPAAAAVEPALAAAAKQLDRDRSEVASLAAGLARRRVELTESARRLAASVAGEGSAS
jgi:argininosuccinate lyase